MLGTPAFMAPEQALGEISEVGSQTDVWAVGATLLTLISGELVHEANNASQLLVKAATTPARSLSTVAPEAPDAVVRLVAQALAFDRAQQADQCRDPLGRHPLYLHAQRPFHQHNPAWTAFDEPRLPWLHYPHRQKAPIAARPDLT